MSNADELVWLKNPTGEYSTRSGYLVLTEERTPTDPTASTVWLANVWNIKTAEKVKLFIWKSLHGALPVGEQFAIRNIHVSSLCSRCNEVETVSHLLFSCPYAAQVWDLAPTLNTIRPNSITTTLMGWECARKGTPLPPVDLDPGTLASWIVWNLWSSRNHLIFQKRTVTPEETITKAISDAKEWMLAQTPPSPPKMNPLIRIEPNPRSHGTSIFTDAAWNPVSRHAGLGWIIDDLDSSSTFSAISLFVESPLLAESLAVVAAINSALSRRIDSITIFSDSQVLINTINKKEMKLEIFNTLRDIYFLSTAFKSIAFVFIPRVSNGPADSLAKQALWALSPP